MARKRQAQCDDDEIIVSRPAKLLKRTSLPHLDPSSNSPDTPNKSMPATRGSKQKSLKRSRAPDDEVVTPKTKRHHGLPSPANTPSRGASRLLDKLRLEVSDTYQAYQTPPTTPKEEYPDILPKELVELVAIFTAIVTATSAQVATGTSQWRIECGALLKTASATWRKRNITLDDLCTVLPLAQKAGYEFEAEDFGRAGICLARTQHGGVLDTTHLRREFEGVLRRAWMASDQTDVLTFVQQLPRYAIPVHDSVKGAAPLLSRGKARLADLKASQALAGKTPVETVIRSTLNDRGTSLLDRVLAKQANLAAMPAGPTQQELERKAALYRVEDVTRVLDILSIGKARASFSMQSVVQQLQQSLRSPMSRIEVERCLTIMAEEIMPSFMAIVRSGAMSGIVVTRSGKLGIADLKKRLADAGI